METTRGPRILVVDDDRKALDHTLDAIRTHCASYEARVAEGAFEGLDYLFGRGRFHERRRHPLPDLVLLDVGMVPLDGVQVLKRINQADYLREIPVALLCENQEEKVRAMNEGVDAAAYVVKPLSDDALRALLSQRHRRNGGDGA
jgi:two-component system response regulator